MSTFNRYRKEYLSLVLSFLLSDIKYTIKFVLNVLKRSNLSLGLLEVQTTGVVGVKLGEGATLTVTFSEKLVLVERAVVSWYAIEITHVLCLCTFLVS